MGYRVMGYKSGYSDERRYYYDTFPIMVGSQAIISGKVSRKSDRESAFTFQVDALHEFAEKMTPHDTYIEVFFDAKMLFRGRIIKRTEQSNGIISLTCEGLMAYLNDSMINAGTYSGTIEGFLNKIINEYNAQQSTIYQAKHIEAEVTSTGQKVSYTWDTASAWDILKDALLNGKGIKSVAPTYNPSTGEWTFNEKAPIHIVEEDGKLYVVTDELAGSQTISQGVNLIDFSIEESGINDYTHLHAVANVASSTVITEEIFNDTFPECYGTHIDRVVTFPNVSNRDMLRSYGENYIRYTNQNRFTYKVKGFDRGLVHEAEFFSLKRLVVFRYMSKGEWKSKLLPITGIEYNLTNPAADACTLGTVQKKLTEFM